MVSTTWKDQAHRLKPFNGDLIPVFDAGQRISGKIKDHNFNVDQILDFSNLKAIELRTSLELMCIDFDSEKAFIFAEKRGFNWAKNFTWFVQRDNQFSRVKILFKRTVEQQKLGEFYLNDFEHDLEVFSSSSQPVTVLGHHRESGLYRWYGTGPEKLIDCPEKVWNFIVELKQELAAKKTTKTRKSPNRNWRPARPCPVCNRSKDDDCSINKDGTFVLCHHGKTHHPPNLKLGETLQFIGINWAFCGYGSDAKGEFSKFTVHKPSPLAVMAKELGIVK